MLTKIIGIDLGASPEPLLRRKRSTELAPKSWDIEPIRLRRINSTKVFVSHFVLTKTKSH